MRIVRRVVFGKGIEKDNKIVFFGSGRVALPSLRTLIQIYPNLSVITQSSVNQKKNFNEVQKFCRQKELKWSSPIASKDDKQKRKEQWKRFIDNFQMVDFGVVCSYGYMIPSRLINLFKKGLIIVHPSLLPKYKGGAPIFHAIANGDKFSGVSFIQISKQTFDAGNILHQISVPLDPKGQYKQIENQLAEEAAKSLPYVLQNIDDLRPGISQSICLGSVPKEQQLAPLVLTNKLQLNRPAEVVYNWSRALETPRVRLLANGRQIILKLGAEYLLQAGQVGVFRVVGKKLFVGCADGFIRVVGWYEPSRMQQPPGIFIAEFIRSGKYDIERVRVQ